MHHVFNGIFSQLFPLLFFNAGGPMTQSAVNICLDIRKEGGVLPFRYVVLSVLCQHLMEGYLQQFQASTLPLSSPVPLTFPLIYLL